MYTSKISLIFLLTLSLLFCCSTAARPLPAAPSPSASTLLDGATSLANSVSNAFKLVFDYTQPAAAISKNPHRVDEYLRVHFASVLKDAIGVLQSNDCSIMASFLDSQLMGLVDSRGKVLWTVFAPADEDLGQGNLGEDYSRLLMRHLVPGRDVEYRDLNLMANGTRFQKNMDGVPLQLTRNQENPDQLMVNGVEITSPDMFRGMWIVVHGIKGVIPVKAEDRQTYHETDKFYHHEARQET